MYPVKEEEEQALTMNASEVWRAQMEASERGDFEKAISYFDQDCEWRLVTSGKTYRGLPEVRRFIQSGLKAGIKREPEIVAEFGAGEWGAFEYVSRGQVSREAVAFSKEVGEQPRTSPGRALAERLFRLFFAGKHFEVPVCFIFHITTRGLIDRVHEYAATRR